MYTCNYYCKSCRRIYRDQLFNSHSEAPDSLKCDCGEKAEKCIPSPRFRVDTAYKPGLWAEDDIGVANDYYEHRLYSEDENKKGVNSEANLKEV